MSINRKWQIRCGHICKFRGNVCFLFFFFYSSAPKPPGKLFCFCSFCYQMNTLVIKRPNCCMCESMSSTKSILRLASHAYSPVKTPSWTSQATLCTTKGNKMSTNWNNVLSLEQSICYYFIKPSNSISLVYNIEYFHFELLLFLYHSQVNGNYASWSAWKDCSATCGGGIQQRLRSCTNPVPKNGGKDCNDLGPALETKNCNSQPCPS